MATAAVSTAPLDGIAYAPPARQRVDSIDLLRGLVMVIMMLDHTRDYFNAAQYQFDPTDLTKTSVALFLTRWITHYCAPVFFFLAGTGAYLRRTRGATARDMSWFLVSRGVWLIALEMTVIRALISFDVLPHGTYFGQTIWALGWSMIVLAAFVHAPLWVTGAFGGLMVLAHNAFDAMGPRACFPGQPICGPGDVMLRVLHVSGPIMLGPKGPMFIALYPLIPWIGVMALGYVFGRLYTMDAAQRRPLLLRLGGAVIALFVLLRATNLYGDPGKWSVQPRGAAFTLLSYLNVNKYPPSLLYLCMTLGPAILLLAFLEREQRGRLGMAMVHFGRVPMLFYILQWVFAHGVAYAAFVAAGMPTEPLFIFHNNPPDVLARVGFSLPVVYAFWIIGVLALYPICRWYAGVKRRRSDWWLGYL
jgi:uncharacterized membrane protein